MIDMLTISVKRVKTLIIFTPLESRLLGLSIWFVVVTLDNSNQKLFPFPWWTQLIQLIFISYGGSKNRESTVRVP